MIKFLAMLYHLFIAGLAVSLLLVIVVVATYVLAEGVAAFGFGVDLLSWLEELTGYNLDTLRGGGEPAADAEPAAEPGDNAQ